MEVEKLKRAFEKVISNCPNPYARTYAKAGLFLTDEDALRVQAAYVLSNLGGWKDEETIAVLKEVSGTKGMCEICGGPGEVEIEGEVFCSGCAKKDPVQTCKKCGARTSHGDFLIIDVHKDGSKCYDEDCEEEHYTKKYFLCDNCL
ncbi:MAG: hypothetical protein QW228_01045 [Candidatus Aenigmatarchaeota archaeon]